MSIETTPSAAEDLRVILEHLQTRTPVPAEIQKRARQRAEAITKALPETDIAAPYKRESRDR